MHEVLHLNIKVEQVSIFTFTHILLRIAFV